MKQSSQIIFLAITSFFILFFWINLPRPEIPAIPLPSPTPANTRVKTTPMPYLSPTPLPLLKADSDIKIRINSVNEYVTVPQGSTYKTDYKWQITIYPTDNISILLCWGCDPVGTFKVCGDGYGMGMEGICRSRDIMIGDWNMGEHYFTTDHRFAFIVGPYKPSLGKSGSDVIIIHTQNNQYPTADELSQIQIILDSMYRAQ